MCKPLKSWDLPLLISILSLCICISIDPVQGLHCYVCSSDNLEDCSTLRSIDELPLELCPSDVASCFTRIDNGVTIRGCLSHRKQTLCSSDTCSFCRSNKCNSQIFPEDRLSCLHCEGSSCVNQSNTIDVRYSCTNYVADDECYNVFSYDGSTAYRGCMSDNPNSNKGFCLDNYAQCNRCKKRACNSDHVEFEKKIACVKCNPDENSNCNVIDDSITATECAATTLGYKNLCYTYQSGDVSHRGCLYEAPENIFDECDNAFSEACLTCNQTDCNRTPIIHEELTLNSFHSEVVVKEDKSELVDNPSCMKLSPKERFCYKCDSNINSNCTNQLDDTMIGLCDFETEDLGCYHMITENRVVRGCVKDLEEEMKQKCITNDDSCKRCIEQNCNSRANFSECLVTDADQSKAWNNFESLSSPKICKNYVEQCFVQVIKEDTVIRGCVDTYAAEHDLSVNFLNEIENNRTYQVCSGHLCNNKEVKPMYCMSCNSTDKTCINDPYSLYLRKRCRPLEVHHSGCYHFDNGTYVERGCIADLDEKQRTDCESDSDKCKRCIGTECNTRKNFLKCLWSLNDNVSRLPKSCRRYNDECYILAKNGAVRRGCFSDLIDTPIYGVDIATDCQNRDIYERCITAECNSREIESEYCTVCSSETDYKNQCKYGPNDNMRKQCPIRLHKLGCYMQRENIVKRGCVTELSLEERHECRSLNGTCKICNGDACNKKAFFEVCKTCSSENDENCIAKPFLSADRTCPNYMDQCYYHVKDGIVKRDCIGDGFINTIEECANSEYCLHCTGGTRCNNKEIRPEICLDCDSNQNETCKSFPSFQQQYYTVECPIAVQPEGCYHFIDKNNGRHIRGCVTQLSDDNKKRYNEKIDEFRICKGPKCNSRSSLERCLICNSKVDSDCALSPNSSYSKTCNDYNNMCFTFISQHNVIRGCLNDLKEAPRVQCQHDKERCDICSTVDSIGCNKTPVEMDTCIECDSTETDDCRLNPNENDRRICAHIEPRNRKGCYLSIIGDHVKRGCIEDLTPSDGRECQNGTDTCKSCDWSNCNMNPVFQKCYNCNSKDDPRCARGIESAKIEVCKTYYSECTTGIDQEGYTIRGCSIDYKNRDDFSHRYDNCVENNCNDKIYPENRLKCYHCNGNENCNYMSPNSTDINLQPQPCGIISDFDQCFTYINKDKKMFRGCASDPTQIRLECEANDENKQGICVKCTDTGCNDQPKVKRSELSCMKCSDSKECAYGQSSSPAFDCLNNVTFGNEESCFVRTLPGTSIIERDCTLDVNATDSNWCQSNEGCEKCFAKDCNTQNVRFSWCLRCQSDINGNCAKISDPNEFIEECDYLPYPYEKRGCYTMSKDGIVTRGCNIDIGEEQYENCRKDESCTLCQDDYCNNEVINSGANTTSHTLICIYMLLIAYFAHFF